MPRAILPWVALVWLLTTTTARAQSTEADRPLATLSASELRVLAPLLRTGVVSLVEHAGLQELPAIVLAAEVLAPASTVAEVIANPEAYPTFMPALTDVRVEARDGAALSYAWTWQTAIFSLRGSNTIEAFPPPADHPEVGYRFVVRSTAGDLGTGRTVWRVLPRGDRTLLLASSRMDMRDANYVARQLAASAGGYTVNRTINIALATSMLIRTRAEAEHRSGATRPRASMLREPPRPTTEPSVLAGLFGRGDVLWVETSDGSDLGRVAAYGRMPAPEERVRAAILDPAGFMNGLLSGAHVEVLEHEGDRTRFAWGIDVPLVGTSGQMVMDAREGGVLGLDGTEGSLDGASWRFSMVPEGDTTLVMAWGNFDLADGLWLIRILTDRDASMRPGLSSAAELMMLRGLRLRLERGF